MNGIMNKRDQIIPLPPPKVIKTNTLQHRFLVSKEFKLWSCVGGRDENKIWLNYHRERFRELTFRPLALRQSEGLTLN